MNVDTGDLGDLAAQVAELAAQVAAMGRRTTALSRRVTAVGGQVATVAGRLEAYGEAERIMRRAGLPESMLYGPRRAAPRHARPRHLSVAGGGRGTGTGQP